MAPHKTVIGVFGGTFDPVHLGHLHPLRELQPVLQLRQVLLVPAAQPPHRPAPQADAGHRLAMLRLACAGSADWVVDDRELRRAGPSYSVDTLLSLRADYPDEELCLVLGQDALLGLPGWHRWRELFDLAGIAVMKRPGVMPETPDWLAERLVGLEEFRGNPRGHCYLHPVRPVDISASRVRELLAAGRDVGALVPTAVLHYIEKHSLYRKTEVNLKEDRNAK